MAYNETGRIVNKFPSFSVINQLNDEEQELCSYRKDDAIELEDLTDSPGLQKGDKVEWRGVDTGFVKRIQGTNCYVVFNFNDDPDNWENYTGEMCDTADLVKI